jgi:large subunit ribosomal protein L29
MLKAKELKEQSVEELKVLCGDLSKEIYGLKNELRTTRKLEKPHLLREKKRDKARVMTVLRQKEE